MYNGNMDVHFTMLAGTGKLLKFGMNLIQYFNLKKWFLRGKQRVISDMKYLFLSPRFNMHLDLILFNRVVLTKQCASGRR